MDISIFLAQAFGLYLVIGALALLINKKAMQDLIDLLAKNRSSVMLGGFLTLIVGIPLVLSHNIWDGTWRTVVTVLAWLTLLKGITRVMMPEMVVAWGSYFEKNRGLLKSLLLFMLAVGGYLLYVGFGL